jgi:hypothetical protein
MDWRDHHIIDWHEKRKKNVRNATGYTKKKKLLRFRIKYDDGRVISANKLVIIVKTVVLVDKLASIGIFVESRPSRDVDATTLLAALAIVFV